MAKHWYAVHTYAGQEDKVKQNIERRVKAFGLEEHVARVMIPSEESTVLRTDRKGNSRKVTVKRKVYPGYVLVEMEMDDTTWHFVRQTVGVTGFVGQVTGTATKPPPLTTAEVDSLLTQAGEEAPSRRQAMYHKGDKVAVIAGPFAGSEGSIQEIHVKNEKVTVLIPVFGRDTRVDLDFAAVQRRT